MLCGLAAADFPNLRYNDISFQYLEIRYNSRLVRTLASLSYVIASVASTGIALYAPCLSLRTVTGLPLVGLVLMAGLIATFYTVLVCTAVSREAWATLRESSSRPLPATLAQSRNLAHASLKSAVFISLLHLCL